MQVIDLFIITEGSIPPQLHQIYVSSSIKKYRKPSKLNLLGFFYVYCSRVARANKLFMMVCNFNFKIRCAT